MIVEGHLGDIEFGYQVAITLSLDDRLVLHHTHRCTVVGCLCTTTKGHMVVLYESCALDLLVEVRVIAQIHITFAVLLVHLSELVGVEHLHALVN